MAYKIPGTDITIKAPDPIIKGTGDKRESGTGGGRDLSKLKDRANEETFYKAGALTTDAYNEDYADSIQTLNDAGVFINAKGEVTTTPTGYVYKGKGAAHKGEYRVNVGKDVRELANNLGVDVPTGWTGNRSTAAANATKFNDELKAAIEADAQANLKEEVTTTTDDGFNDPFQINVGDGEFVEAADPVNYGLGGDGDVVTDTSTLLTDTFGGTNLIDETGGTVVGGGNTENFDEVISTSGDPNDNFSTNTLADGTFVDNYLSGTGNVIEGLEGGLSVKEATSGTSIAPGQSSAISGVVDTILATDNSTGAAEDEAIADYTAGTRGTIMTSPQGLLTDDDDFFTAANLEDDPFLRPTRTLGGGLLY
tara:strand:- start:211 stop:1308 length:1098 start_codon:yes stop_codon:yes gene_type:complete